MKSRGRRKAKAKLCLLRILICITVWKSSTANPKPEPSEDYYNNYAYDISNYQQLAAYEAWEQNMHDVYSASQDKYEDYTNDDGSVYETINICKDLNGNDVCCAGWTKANESSNNCDVPICPEGCGIEGACIGPNKCFCSDQGTQVEGSCDNTRTKLENERKHALSCEKNCNDGLCRLFNGQEECICPDGLEGEFCDQPVCGDGCGNEGTCVKRGGEIKCDCKEGFTGDDCDIDYRHESCYTKTNPDGSCNQRYVTDLQITKKDCCSTIGHAWGHYCEPCSVNDHECPQGYEEGARDPISVLVRSSNFTTTDKDQSNCVDIDECKLFNHNICFNGRCVNTPGSFMCICPAGFVLDDDTKICRDIDECTELEYCPDSCKNTEGSWECHCPEDHETTLDNKACIYNPEGMCHTEIVTHYGIDNSTLQECAKALPVNVSRRDCCCAGSLGANRCFEREFCPDPDLNYKEWADICKTETHDSTTPSPIQDPNRQNMNGNDKMSENETECPEGYCENGYCELDASGLLCVCFEGYTWNDSTKGCIKVNFCSLNPDACEHGKCHPLEIDEYADYGDYDLREYYCSCDKGFITTEDGQACENINECRYEGQNKVCENGKCIDSMGSYSCICNDGFEDQDGTCTDINECQEEGDLCLHGKCYNINGGYGCLCNPGYIESEDKHSCKDIDECTNASTCLNGRCKNLEGSYVCDCNKGFESKMVLKTDPVSGEKTESSGCVDINECLKNPCEFGSCTNTESGFRCNCDDFYKFDGEKCVRDDTMSTCSRNIDSDSFKCIANNTLSKSMTQIECCCPATEGTSAWGSNCSLCPNANSDAYAKMCENLPPIDYCVVLKELPCGIGGYCNSLKNDYDCTCKIGFKPTSDKRDCIDIDECKQDYCTGETAKCENTVGSYKCSCGNGYVLENNVCIDIDECDSSLHPLDQPCKGESICRNTPGGYTCDCSKIAYDPVTGMQSNPNNTCQDETRSKCWKRRDDENDDPFSSSNNNNRNMDRNSDPFADLDNQRGDTKHPFDQFNNNKNNGKCENSANRHLSKEECCNTIGQGWGENCESCKENKVDVSQCKNGFKRNRGNGKCEDINECLILDPCKSGCENTEGSYYCTCQEGLTLAKDGQNCLDERLGVCYSEWNGEQGAGLFEGVHNKDVCCCSIGKAWMFGNKIEPCPSQESPEFTELCLGTDQGGCHKPDPSSNKIEDTNECMHFPHLCGEHGTCINKENCQGFSCDCDPGYDINTKGLKCVDINECELSKTVCGVVNGTLTGTCLNTDGGFTCICKEGYHLDKYGKCVDVDECKAFNVCRQGTCINTNGDYLCQCPSTFRLSPDGKSCENINQCILDNGKDNPEYCRNGHCINKINDYTCQCNPGYKLSPDGKECKNINECECKTDKYKHKCSDLATCSDTDGSYECFCPEGTKLAEDKHTCVDINDCIEKPGICGRNQAGKCINENVEILSRNEKGRGKTFTNGYRCECNQGYKLENDVCIDIDECIEDPTICGQALNETTSAMETIGKCKNTQGHYTCNCELGFCIDPERPDQPTCINEDECALGNHQCHINAECTDMIGDYSCKCLDGFEGDGMNCIDTDECTDDNSHMNDCHPENGLCRNRFGDYFCECKQGWHGDGVNCTNVDECDKNPNLCKSGQNTAGICLDLPGSYECECFDGFNATQDGKACIDLDECSIEEENFCSNGICHNLHGSFACQCFKGFTLSDDLQQCVDVDECEENPFDSCRGGICVNTHGGFDCICQAHEEKRKIHTDANQGYYACVDIREGSCFVLVEPSTGECQEALPGAKVTKADCCCNDLGAGWLADNNNEAFNGDTCELCPLYTDPYGNGTVSIEYQNLCNTDCPVGGCVNSTVSVLQSDVDECAVFGDSACQGGICENTEGSFLCTCPKGFDLMPGIGKLKKCVDINECLLAEYETGEKPCSPGGTCHNLEGGYRCECKKPEFIPHTWKGHHMCLDNQPGVCSKVDTINTNCTIGEKQTDNDLLISKRACCCIGNLGNSFNCEVSSIFYFFKFTRNKPKDLMRSQSRK